MSMQVFYTERAEGSCNQLDFALQLRGVVATDRLQLQYTRLGGDVVKNYTEREISEKLWQYLYGDIYRNLEMLLCCGIPGDQQSFLKLRDRMHSLRKLVRSKLEGGQFIRVDDLNMKTLNEEKQKAECDRLREALKEVLNCEVVTDNGDYSKGGTGFDCNEVKEIIRGALEGIGQ